MRKAMLVMRAAINVFRRMEAKEKCALVRLEISVRKQIEREMNVERMSMADQPHGGRSRHMPTFFQCPDE